MAAVAHLYILHAKQKGSRNQSSASVQLLTLAEIVKQEKVNEDTHSRR